MKKASSLFYPQTKIMKALENVEKYKWAKTQQQNFKEAAKPWLKFTDDELWDMIYSPKLLRAWMVLSDGCCPSCKKSVPMYNWRIDALNKPWKLSCPHCEDVFPKNDFHKYYVSGLDINGAFDPSLADRSLLYNEEHPDKEDTLHMFGVDDGWGYPEGKRKWLFAATYLVKGQWKQLIYSGIRKLSNAYIVTGEQIYAHKGGILLDRLADFFPDYDWKTQATYYEDVHVTTGYLSYCVDSCIESQDLGLSYDRIFDGIKDDTELVRFLSQKAQKYGIENNKKSFEQIQKNIEERILEDSIIHAYDKNHCNYPQCHVTDSLLRSVLKWPENKDEIMKMLLEIVEKTTAVDGVTGEKGLASYGCWGARSLTIYLSRFESIDKGFMEYIFNKFPRIHDTYRFHIDTWCLGKFYPRVGDDGIFADTKDFHAGVFTSNPAQNKIAQKKEPSLQYDMSKEFLWNLYKHTGDILLAQALYISAAEGDDFTPCSIFSDNVEAAGNELKDVIKNYGTDMKIGSSLKKQWHIAMLRSGIAKDERVAWISFDSGYGHGHCNGMNLGLFAKGRDLMPDLGYPPVQYGGWGSVHFNWYTGSNSHNTVVVDRQNHIASHRMSNAGECTLWEPGKEFNIAVFSGPELIKGRQYERTLCTMDISSKDSYIVDIFRVAGGSEHVKYMHGSIGSIHTDGLTLSASNDFNDNQFLKDVMKSEEHDGVWSVDWKNEYDIENKSNDRDIHLKYTDLTLNAQVYTCESWICLKGYNHGDEAWMPSIMVRKVLNEEQPVSTFIGVIEPYENQSNIQNIKRLELHYKDGSMLSNSDVALEITLKDGHKDLIIAIDTEDIMGLKVKKVGESIIQKDWNIILDGQFGIYRQLDGMISKLY